MRKAVLYIGIGLTALSLWGCRSKETKLVATDSNASVIVETDSNGKEIILDDKLPVEVRETENGEIRGTRPQIESMEQTTEEATRPSEEKQEIMAEQGEPTEFRGIVESVDNGVYKLLITGATSTITAEVKATDVKDLDKTLKNGDSFVMTAYYSAPFSGTETSITVEQVESLISETTEESNFEELNASDNEQEVKE